MEACEEKPSGGPSLEVEHDTIEQFVALNIRQDPDLAHAMELLRGDAVQGYAQRVAVHGATIQDRRRTITARDAIHSTTS